MRVCRRLPGRLTYNSERTGGIGPIDQLLRDHANVLPLSSLRTTLPRCVEFPVLLSAKAPGTLNSWRGHVEASGVVLPTSNYVDSVKAAILAQVSLT
jgi:hypothetical protein